VNNFNISRINTLEGTFKIKGHWQRHPQKIVFIQLEIMSTDGWQVLDLKHQSIIKLIPKIDGFVLQHLMFNN